MAEGRSRGFVGRRARILRAAAISPVVILLASATRLLLISNYNSTTATTIASSVGVTGTLLGTVVPLLPPYLPVALIASVVLRRWVLSVFVGLATALLSPSFAPGIRYSWDYSYEQTEKVITLAQQYQWAELWNNYPYAALSAGTGALFIVLMARDIVDVPESFGETVIRTILYVPYLIVVPIVCAFLTLMIQVTYQVPFDADIASAIGRRPWLPAEQITLKSGEKRNGYTLSQDVNWHTVLDEDDRLIVYIKSADIATRIVCRPAGTNIDQAKLPLLPARGSRLVSTPECSTDSQPPSQ